jgi:dihydroorotate dehydrogenase
MLRYMAPIVTDVSEERSTSIIGVTGISELLRSVRRLLLTANVVFISTILVTLMIDALRSSETSVFTRSHGLTSQKTAFFILTTVKTSNKK